MRDIHRTWERSKRRDRTGIRRTRRLIFWRENFAWRWSSHNGLSQERREFLSERMWSVPEAFPLSLWEERARRWEAENRSGDRGNKSFFLSNKILSVWFERSSRALFICLDVKRFRHGIVTGMMLKKKLYGQWKPQWKWVRECIK